MHAVRTSLGICATLALAACAVERAVQNVFDERTPRERYEDALEQAGLAGTALARDWSEAAVRSVREAPAVTPPHIEEGFVDPAKPAAFGFRFRAERGQEVAVALEWRDSALAGLVFIEAWHLQGDSLRTMRRVAVADSGASTLIFEPRRAGEHVVRLQPELLRGGRFRLTVRVGPTLAFPVREGTDNDIGSPFGAPRDGGARSHQGIDIFARRGTPALATGEATVSRVDEDRLGGLVVWLRDRRGNSIYYAHLDTQLVREGDVVQAGDVVGLVGRTGNARRTPAHLHFSVYRRGEGPLDPYWFVARPSRSVPRLMADTSLLGAPARTRRPARILAYPDRGAMAVDSVSRHAEVQVLGAVGSWYRVRLPGGSGGFVPSSLVERTLD